ncbi:hypothetical protein EZJ49_07125 [Bdellovibrio bacteriovorus]|uniref:hypothetical protein n=1 Tax=Bdellovibrio bacteriovorus TaxID=959 RepID=UPI0021D3841B|nr:hypothetical protein [Bdellovibrio bacteriovorus]UXR66018.1 hypothetical protein EZJ49_07125 [Bdellovibrio bacteriovorus]
MDSTISLSRQARFKILSENISKAIEEEGFLVRPFSHPTMPHFNRLSIEEQEQVLKDLLTYYQVCMDMKLQGESLKDTRKFTECALARLNKKADPAIMDLLRPDHLVEIYNTTQTQVFRSLPYFEVCSYSLEDVYCRKWYHLYERSLEDQEQLDKYIGLFYAQNPLRTIEVHAPEHIIRENGSLERMEILTKMWWLSPLFSTNQEDIYILAVETSRLP